MKNALLYLFFFTTCFTTIAAQDLIELVSGEQIEAKVLEIGYEIRYLRTDFMDGPVYILERPEVLMITYANGFEEIINLEAAQQDNTFAVREAYLRVGSNKYYEGFRQINREEFLLKLQSRPGAYANYQSGRSLQRAGYITAGGGLLISLVGITTMFRNATDQVNGYAVPGNVKSPKTGLLWTGMGISLAGVAIVAGGQQRINRALDSYNISIGQTGSLQPVWNGDGVGVALRF